MPQIGSFTLLLARDRASRSVKLPICGMSYRVPILSQSRVCLGPAPSIVNDLILLARQAGRANSRRVSTHSLFSNEWDFKPQGDPCSRDAPAPSWDQAPLGSIAAANRYCYDVLVSIRSLEDA